MVHISDKITLKKVHELKPYDRNNKQHPDAQVEKLALSIQTFGFRVPIIIDDHDLIIAGHGRLLAAKKLGLDEVPCIVADNLTTDQIKAFRIMDNKSAVSEFEEHNLKLELGCYALTFTSIGKSIKSFCLNFLIEKWWGRLPIVGISVWAICR